MNLSPVRQFTRKIRHYAYRVRGKLRMSRKVLRGIMLTVDEWLGRVMVDLEIILQSAAIDCEALYKWIDLRLKEQGLIVVRSFDLDRARQSQQECNCPMTEVNDPHSEMIIFHVYKNLDLLATFVLHGQDGFSTLSMVEYQDLFIHQELKQEIFDLLAGIPADIQ
jgi:hypothetical protein